MILGMTKKYCVYILASKNGRAIYIGSTSNLAQRISQHKNKEVDGFSKKYNCINLVYFEELDSAYDMVLRERQLKNWHRDWKNNLITEFNPEWRDLTDSIY